jgi:hypothetical protein
MTIEKQTRNQEYLQEFTAAPREAVGTWLYEAGMVHIIDQGDGIIGAVGSNALIGELGLLMG